MRSASTCGNGVVRSRASPTAGCVGRAEVPRRRSTISGTIWMALAPVPITATRLPVRSTPWSHSAEWKAAASEFVEPLDVGDQRDVQRARAGDQELRDVLLPVVGEHVPARTRSSSQCARSTCELNRM